MSDSDKSNEVKVTITITGSDTGSVQAAEKAIKAAAELEKDVCVSSSADSADSVSDDAAGSRNSADISASGRSVEESPEQNSEVLPEGGLEQNSTGEDNDFVLIDSDAPDEPNALDKLADTVLSRWSGHHNNEDNQDDAKDGGNEVSPSASSQPDLKFEIIRPDGSAAADTQAAAGEPLEERRRRHFSLLESQELVMLPVPGMVVFPNTIIPLSVESEMAVKAVEYAIDKELPLFLVAKRRTESASIAKTALYKTGCICAPVQAMRLPSGSFRLVLHGIVRARIVKVTSRSPFAKVRVSVVENENKDEAESASAMQVVHHQFREAASLSHNIPPEMAMTMSNVHDPGQIADLIASNLNLSLKEKQSILDIADAAERLRKVSLLLSREIEILKIENKIQNKAEMEMAKGHKEYFLRQQIRAIQEELGDAEDEDAEIQKFSEAVENSGMPETVAEHARKEIKRLKRIPSSSPDYSVICIYLEKLLQFPWKTVTEDVLDLKKAAAILDEEHFGLEEVKERILECLAVRKLNPEQRGPILCFVGPPGVGKTSLGRSIARTMGRKFNRTSLGGMHDEAEIRGHRRTYVASMPGRIIEAFCNAGSRNPVIMLDEIDKVGTDFRGDPASALLEALDPEQNCEFKDNYLGVPVDLSAAMFIMTANVLDTIPPALRDRMEIIRISGYTSEEKREIAKGFLIPRQRENNGLNENMFRMTDEAVDCVIREYTREAGVRSLEREIGSLCRKTARRAAESRKVSSRSRKSPALRPEEVRELLGVPKFIDTNKIEEHPFPGSVQGLSWTEAGGEMLTIEANVIPGRGKVTLTGSLGKVMKESAKTAITWSRGFLRDHGIDFDYYQNDIHVHVPEGAIPKDGPSAGITLACAFISAVLGRPARQEIAMTGEITLTGRVMPIGGVKEKVLAAFNASIREIILPEENRRHIKEIPEAVREQIKFNFVRHAKEVVEIVLGTL